MIFLPAVLILACYLSRPAFCMMYSACKLNKQVDSIQPWHTSFLILNQSVVPCLVLTVNSWPAHRFLRRQVRWSGIPISQNFPQFVVIHTVKGFSVVNEAEVDVFQEFSFFFYDPVDVGNLISGSSAFSKSSLYIWKFSVHMLLTPSLKDFEHYFASMWNKCSCAVFEHSLALSFFGVGMKADFFQFCGHFWVFQHCWHIVCSTTVSSSRILNSSLEFHHSH